MQVRHGNMVVGSTSIGKTTLTLTLRDALTSLFKDGHVDPWFKPVTVDTLNPKSVTMGELYGEVNKFTQEWTEGIVSSLVKNAVEKKDDEKESTYKRWILFDGPVDALWIENMNTVLDDNKMLCLSSGQRIKMPDTCTMLFEVNDLKVASPATVSRCGMVYLEPIHLGWEPLIETWAEKMKDEILSPDPTIDEIKTIILTIFKNLLPQVREKCKETIPSVDSNLVASCLKLVTIYLNKEAIKLDDKEKYPATRRIVMTYISFSIIWSLGANIQDKTRPKFSELFRIEIKRHFPEFPDDHEIYELGLDHENHTFKQWSEILALNPFKYNPEVEFFDILVPTSDTVKFKYLLQTLMNDGKNVLISGETGVGKSVITKDFLTNIDRDKFVFTFVNFSGKTSTKNLQDAFEGNLARKRKTLLAPEQAGKKMIFFIDDVNMP